MVIDSAKARSHGTACCDLASRTNVFIWEDDSVATDNLGDYHTSTPSRDNRTGARARSITIVPWAITRATIRARIAVYAAMWVPSAVGRRARGECRARRRSSCRASRPERHPRAMRASRMRLIWYLGRLDRENCTRGPLRHAESQVGWCAWMLHASGTDSSSSLSLSLFFTNCCCGQRKISLPSTAYFLMYFIFLSGIKRNLKNFTSLSQNAPIPTKWARAWTRY